MTVTAHVDTVPSRVRFGNVDAARGLAIVLMVIDHICLVADVLPEYRLTLGRAAMPLFFIVSGMFVTRLHWRHVVIGVIGLALPAVVPWIDAPNVLLIYALSVPVIVLARRYRFLPLLIAVALTLGANHYIPNGRWFDPFCLLGLMALGVAIGPLSLGWAYRLPRFLSILGRYPLIIYVSHLLILEGLRNVL